MLGAAERIARVRGASGVASVSRFSRRREVLLGVVDLEGCVVSSIAVGAGGTARRARALVSTRILETMLRRGDERITRGGPAAGADRKTRHACNDREDPQRHHAEEDYRRRNTPTTTPSSMVGRKSTARTRMAAMSLFAGSKRT